MRPILNIDEVVLADHGHGERFAARIGQLGNRLGAVQIGCRLTVVPPGKAAWPYHCHHANEEMFVVLAGIGTLRYGGAEHPLRQGDVVMCPAGGPETAHQIVNSGSADLRYLAISTMREPDVMEYPDSRKFAILSGAPPGGDEARRRLQYAGREEDSLDYWEGE